MLSVHVIDCAYGASAANVEVCLRRRTQEAWVDVAQGVTSVMGRLEDWHDGPLKTGTYQLQFNLDSYFAALGIIPLYPRALIEFRASDPTMDLHLPLLITPNSIQCYRGDRPPSPAFLED